MSTPVRTYHSEMHSNLGFFATWLPGDPIELGDAGVLIDGRFRRLSSLNELRIPFDQGEIGVAQNIQYTSTKGTKIDFKAKVKAGGVAEANIAVDFSNDGAFIFHAAGMRARRINDIASVGKKLLDAYEAGRWHKNWLLIESLHVADCATIIVSQEDSASLTLSAKVDAGLSAFSLADPRIGLEISSSRGKLVHFIGAKKLRPLFSCIRIQPKLLGKPIIAPARGISTQMIEFERAEITDLLES